MLRLSTGEANTVLKLVSQTAIRCSQYSQEYPCKISALIVSENTIL